MSCYSETDDSLAGKSRWNRPDHLTPPTQAQVRGRTCPVNAVFQILTAALFGGTYCKRSRGLDWIDWRACAQSATRFLVLESILTPLQTIAPILIRSFYLSRRVLQLYVLSVPFGIEVFPGVTETTWCPVQCVLT